MTGNPDPRGVIAEAFAMPGVGEAECRSIFLDWVLGLPEGAEVPLLAQRLLAQHDRQPDHPMAGVLRAAMSDAATPRRRGGRARLSGRAPLPRPRGR